MTLFRLKISITAFFFSYLSYAEVQLEKGAFDKGDLDAVGAVISLDHDIFSLGTGTYIGNKSILTAAHVLKYYLPQTVENNDSPVVVDLSDKKVFWTNDEDFGEGDPINRRYKVTKVITDACFIKNGGEDVERPTAEMMKCDVAILKLDREPHNIRAIEIARDLESFPLIGVHIGYGVKNKRPTNFKRKIKIQAIAGMERFGNWSLIFTNLTGHNHISSIKLADFSRHLKPLLGSKHLNRKELSPTLASEGDSGGPLIIQVPDSTLKIIGVLSAYSQTFNSFPSLLMKESGEYHLNHLIVPFLKS